MNRYLNSLSLHQHWLVALIVIGLHATFGEMAHASPSDPLLSYSGGNLKMARMENYPVPKKSVANVENECQCGEPDLVEVELQISSSRIEELTAQLGMLNANVSRHEHESISCQKALANAVTDRSYSKSLEEKIERMERDYSQVLNETYAEIELLEETAKHQKRNIKSKEDRYQDTRKKYIRVDAELLHMHKSAVSQYVNFTLMREDAWNSVEKRFSKANRHMERHRRKLRPHISEAKRRYIAWKRETNASLQPKILSFKRNMHKLWIQSKTVRPLFESSWENIKDYPALVEARVAGRLSAISTIEETSKVALAYLKKEDQMKQDELERQRKRKKDPMRRQLEYNKRNRGATQTDSEEFVHDIEPSFFKAKAHAFFKSFFKYTLKNSERVFEKGVALFPLAVALSVTRSSIVGGFFLFCGIPTPLIWVLVMLRFIRMRWAKKSHNS